MPEHPRIRREKKTVGHMVALYCRKRHGGRDQLCSDCRELLDYAFKRLDKCPFQERKPTCGKCTVHCYKSGMKEEMQDVMRSAGPHMVYIHPIEAIAHLIDGFRGQRDRKGHRL